MSESSGLPPEQDAVRRLLADARHDGPPPPDVVDRLDETLASLVAERSGGLTSEHTSEHTSERTAGAATGHDDGSPGRLVDLGSRRRRVASIGLLAAASVVVAGVAIGQALPRGSDDAADSSAGSASDSSVAESPEDGGGSSDDAGGSGPDNLADTEAREPKEDFMQPGLAGGPTLFSDDDEDIVGQLVALRPDASDGRQRLKSLAALRDCDGVDPGPSAAAVSATVDGEPGLVVFRRPVGAEQGVELYACDDPAPLRTITLPAP
ncbi:hypothetical protein AAII07_00005 [Microvirga sp. 0TCS3.31]